MPEQLIGTWHLASVVGVFDDFFCEFSDGDRTWDINESNITVAYNGVSDATCDALEEGSYTYSVFESNGEHILLTDNEEYGRFTINGNEWLINRIVVPGGTEMDEFQFKLIKQ